MGLAEPYTNETIKVLVYTTLTVLHMHTHIDSHQPRSHCPVASSSFKQSREPQKQVMCAEVNPSFFGWFILEPCLSNTFTTSDLLFFAHDIWRGVLPLLSLQLTGAPCCSSSITRFTLPTREASQSSLPICSWLLCGSR